MSKIEWTERTWNPIVGCSIVSPGCTNCYAMRMAARLEAIGLLHYRGLTQPSKAGPVWSGNMALASESTLLEPMRRKKPTTWFVNSMGDLFHESVTDDWIDRVFAVMAMSPQHTFQVLTKRSSRMLDYCNDKTTPHRVAKVMDAFSGEHTIPWPLPNCWKGVSAERQLEADDRIPDLLATPAAVRFVSAEPLLGPIDFTSMVVDRDTRIDVLQSYTASQTATPGIWDHAPNDGPRLDWVIVGGESGPGARPMQPEWARSIRDQCTAAGVPFFFKQWGEFHPFPAGGVERVGKRAAGRLLDGREWSGMPS